MSKLLLVGIGGFLGASCRFIVVDLINRNIQKPLIPFGTFTVNMLGCFMIGLLNGLAETRQIFTPEIRMLLFVGFLGSFTTFSTFGYETLTLTKEGDLLSGGLNILAHLLVGLPLVWLGGVSSRLL
ncbi:MAG: fluoride efflux transporter CrcB [SAR324 cluster bacterium]|uniref:Fluoride-specific ion channel FluC n=1 Tax=SAR324 cluster bacterium TaxID=2024889 RepID=A0A2A4TBA7_9DELT|nr:MAG: fluoride efflux transporter CrcB [SAR324 cluster bacterium]